MTNREAIKELAEVLWLIASSLHPVALGIADLDRVAKKLRPILEDSDGTEKEMEEGG